MKTNKKRKIGREPKKGIKKREERQVQGQVKHSLCSILNPRLLEKKL